MLPNHLNETKNFQNEMFFPWFSTLNKKRHRFSVAFFVLYRLNVQIKLHILITFKKLASSLQIVFIYVYIAEI